MARIPIAAAIALLSVACSSEDRVLPQTPVDPAPTITPAVPRPIVVGQQVEATLVGHGAAHTFDLTAPSTGTLVVRLAWDRPALVEVWLGDHPVAQTSNSPLIGRVSVSAGATYQLLVADGAAWDYGTFVLPYRLTTEIEQ